MTADSQLNKQQQSTTAAAPIWRVTVRRVFNTLITLLVVAFLSLYLLTLAERGRAHLPAQSLSTVGETVVRLGQYLFNHPQSYTWSRQEVPAFKLVFDIFINSAGLLLVSILFATIAGVLLGMLAARSKGRLGSALVLTFSVLGMSTPSFLFAMLLWVFNIHVINRGLGLKALPPTGLGWDLHLVMPALVLAARPLAQIAQITYITLRDVLEEDFIRTAHAKGVMPRLVFFRHALRNILIPVLTTIGTSLRYSIASLPVVEFFFVWPGLGLALLQAINLGMPLLVTDLIVALGLFFVLFNLGLDFVYPILDARLRKDGGSSGLQEPFSLREMLIGIYETIRLSVIDLLVLIGIRKRKIDQLPALPQQVSDNGIHFDEPAGKKPSWKQWFKWIFGNPALLVGGLLLIGWLVVVIFGEGLVKGNPYEIHGVMMVEGTIGAPPFDPSNTFPWGTDHLGRDIQALVFAGGSRTLLLAFAIMIARMVIGTVLGIIAGWWQDGRFDRLINRLFSIWAAFPITIFAMLLIQAIGIQQGAWVFVVALCVVGWGEVTQFVRSQTIRIKPELFIEASKSLGASAGEVLLRQVFPNLVSSLLVVAALEMGGILMLLAELGFLNIFLGGGFRVELSVDSYVFFSDIPEWGALLANIRDWWRSYPWMAWYAGVAFFLAIMTFNLFSEGLRRFLEDSRVNLSRIFNRYTLIALLVIGTAFAFVMRSQSPIGVYKSYAKAYNEGNAYQVIEDLSSPIFMGRESGTVADLATAEYIADNMRAIGLFPPDGDGPYIQESQVVRLHMLWMPTLEQVDENGNVLEEYQYRQDFVEIAGPSDTYGEGSGTLVGLAFGPATADENAIYDTMKYINLEDKAVLVREADFRRPGLENTGMTLVIVDDDRYLSIKKLYTQTYWRDRPKAQLYVSQDLADRLLQTTGSSLEAFEKAANNLKTGEVFITDPGARLQGTVYLDESMDDKYHTVIGVLPGEGAAMGSPGSALDNQVTIVSAYYDGLGNQPDGILYPGANDNASGVATMLELARALKQSPFAPKRTVIFIAWSGGDRGEPLRITDIMGSIKELNGFEINEIIELSGLGAGSGNKVALDGKSSYRLVKLAQDAGKRLGIRTTTRGRGPHQDILSYYTSGTTRQTPTLYISWDGADETAHTPQDTIDTIDPDKLAKSGRLLLLILLVLTREINY